MARRRLDTTGINIKRLELISKGYLRRKEIEEFVPCGSNKASEIYKYIRNQVKLEGLENCSDVILADRVIKHCGLTLEGIKAMAKIESKGL